MLPKGTMRPVKKIVGILLIILGIISLFKVDIAIPLISNVIFQGLVMIFAGYLLVIAGRQL